MGFLAFSAVERIRRLRTVPTLAVPACRVARGFVMRTEENVSLTDRGCVADQPQQVSNAIRRQVKSLPLLF